MSAAFDPERDLADLIEEALIEYDEDGRVFGECGAGAFFLAKFLSDKVTEWCSDESVIALCAEYAGEEPLTVTDVLSQLIYALPDGLYTRDTTPGATS